MVKPISADDIAMAALLRAARAAYIDAVRKALIEAGFDDMPRNGAYVLSAIAQGGGPVISAVAQGGASMAGIIRGLGVTKQAAGQLIDTLVLRGYVERREDKEDRRKLTVALTTTGEDAAHVGDAFAGPAAACWYGKSSLVAPLFVAKLSSASRAEAVKPALAALFAQIVGSYEAKAQADDKSGPYKRLPVTTKPGPANATLWQRPVSARYGTAQSADAPFAAQLSSDRYFPVTLAIAGDVVVFSPDAPPFRGRRCEGVAMRVTNPQAFDGPRLGAALLQALHRLWPATFRIEATLGMVGSAAALQAIEAGVPLDALADQWALDRADFLRQRQAVLLYRD